MGMELLQFDVGVHGWCNSTNSIKISICFQAEEGAFWRDKKDKSMFSKCGYWWVFWIPRNGSWVRNEQEITTFLIRVFDLIREEPRNWIPLIFLEPLNYVKIATHIQWFCAQIFSIVNFVFILEGLLQQDFRNRHWINQKPAAPVLEHTKLVNEAIPNRSNKTLYNFHWPIRNYCAKKWVCTKRKIDQTEPLSCPGLSLIQSGMFKFFLWVIGYNSNNCRRVHY